MSISFYWLERGGRWGLSPSISLADHQKLNVIENWAFYFFGRRGMADGVQVNQSARQIIRSEHNKKMRISFFGWRGVADGVWVHWPAWLIIRSWTKSKNEHFILLAGEGWWKGFESITQPDQSSEVECNPKNEHFIFLAGEGQWMGFESMDQPGKLWEVEHNPKMSISFFWVERDGRWVSSPLTSQADNQKLNVIEKWAFHFIGWRGVADGLWGHRPARLIIRSWT